MANPHALLSRYPMTHTKPFLFSTIAQRRPNIHILPLALSTTPLTLDQLATTARQAHISLTMMHPSHSAMPPTLLFSWRVPDALPQNAGLWTWRTSIDTTPSNLKTFLLYLVLETLNYPHAQAMAAEFRENP